MVKKRIKSLYKLKYYKLKKCDRKMDGDDDKKNPTPIFLENKPYFTSSNKTNHFTAKRKHILFLKRSDMK